MHVVVIGLGEVGRFLVRALSEEGADVYAIDRDPEAAQYVEDHYDVRAFAGHGASQELLERVEVSSAGLVVAVTDDDEVNLIAALAARQLGARRVVARAQGDEWAPWTEGVRHGLLGVDVVINPRVLVGEELARIALSHGASDVVALADSRLELARVQVDKGTAWTRKPLSALDVPEGVLVAGVVREEEPLFVPGGADVLQPGDRVYLIGRPEAVLQAEDRLSRRREARRVFVVGGGVVGQAMTRTLRRYGAKVTLVERDPEHARRLAERFPGVTVIRGDGTDLELLEEEEVDTYDLCAAVTSADEVNLMVALLARRRQVERTAVLVHRGHYVRVYEELGIDVVVSPRSVASDHILRYVQPHALHSLVTLEEGQGEVLELTAGAGARGVGVPLKDLGLPRGVLLAALVRGEQVRVPRGNDVVEPGDRVVVMATRGNRRAVERLLRGGGGG